MPTYEYTCDKCGHAFEIMQGIKEEKLVRCPKCKKHALRRLFGKGGGIKFVGKGFAETDIHGRKWRS
jgi:putative FmdB family regulatory protein